MGQGKAIASLVCGILSFFIGWIPVVGWILPFLSIILGVITLNGVKKGTEQGKGMAIAGIILSSITLVGIILIFAYYGGFSRLF